MEDDFEKLDKLIAEYDKLHGEGKGHELMGSLLRAYGVTELIRLLKKAKGREIVVMIPPDVLDGVEVTFR